MLNNYEEIIVSISWEDVPGFFDFHGIYDQAVYEAPANGVLVEVGALFGRSTLYMAKLVKEARPDLRFYVVDRWVQWPDVIFNEGTVYYDVIKKHGSLFQSFAYYLEQSELSEYVRVIRMDSAEAAEHFRYVDPSFVYIDADHTFAGCLRDISAWQAIMLPGAILAGHDIDWPGVKQAVDECLPHAVVRDKSWWYKL